MKKSAHTKLDSKALNQAALGAKAIKAHKVVSEKEAIHTALYGMDGNLKHDNLPDAKLTSTDLEALKQLENDQANWIAADDQEEATISIAYNDSINSITSQPVADLYAFDTQWSQAQLESINSHISSSVNQKAFSTWQFLLGGAVLGGVAIALSGGNDGGSDGPTDAELFEQFCRDVNLNQNIYFVEDGSNEFNITGGILHSDLGAAASASYSLSGYDSTSLNAAGLSIILESSGASDSVSASVNVFNHNYGLYTGYSTGGSEIIWLDSINIGSTGDASNFEAHVNVTGYAAASQLAEIGICDINIDITEARNLASGTVAIQAYNAATNAQNLIFVHDVSIHASVSGYNGNNNPTLAYAELTVAATAYYSGGEATVEIGTINLFAQNNAHYAHHWTGETGYENFYNIEDVAKAVTLGIAASADSDSTNARISIGSINITASNQTGDGNNAAYVTMDAGIYGDAISANAADSYTNNFASVDIGDISLIARAEDYASVILDGIVAAADGQSGEAHVTIGDLEMKAWSVLTDARVGMESQWTPAYNEISAYAQTNDIATLSIGNITVTAHANDTASAYLTSLSAYASGSNAFASVSVGNILIESHAEAYDGYSHFNGLGIYADSSNAEAEMNIGDITIISNAEEDARAVFDGVSATASGISAYAHGSVGDINLTAISNNNTGYAWFSISVSASNDNATTEFSAGNINLTVQGYDGAEATIESIWAGVDNVESADVIGAKSSITLGDISLQADATADSATGRIGNIGANIYVDGTYSASTYIGGVASSNSASVVIGDINISSGKFINSTDYASAEIGEIKAVMWGEDSLGANNQVNVSIGDINLEARSNAGSGDAGIDNVVVASVHGETNNSAQITIGDISIKNDSYDTASAYIGMNWSNAFSSSYAYISDYSPNLLSFAALADSSNGLAKIDIGNISIIGNGLSGTGYALMGGVSVDAEQTNADASITIGNITLGSVSDNSAEVYFGNEKYGDTRVAIQVNANGFDSIATAKVGNIELEAISQWNSADGIVGAIVASANSTSAHAELEVGTITVHAQADNTAYAVLGSVVASASSQDSSAKVTVSDITLTATSQWNSAYASITSDFGFAWFGTNDGYSEGDVAILAAASYSTSTANVSIGNINLQAIAENSAYASIDGIYAVASGYSASNNGTNSSLTIGDISLYSESTDDDAGAVIDFIEVHAAGRNNTATAVIGDISLVAQANNEDARANIEVYAYAGNSGYAGSSATGNSASVVLGDIYLSAVAYSTASAYLTLSSYATSSLNASSLVAGDITLTAESQSSDDAYLGLYIFAQNEFSDISVGDIDLSLSGPGADGYLTVWNFEDGVTNVDIGNVTLNVMTDVGGSGYFTVDIRDVAWDLDRTLTATGNGDIDLNIALDDVGTAVFGKIDLTNFNGDFNYNFGSNYASDVVLTNQYGDSLSSEISFTTIYNLDLHGSATLETNNVGVSNTSLTNLSDLLADGQIFSDVSDLWASINSAIVTDEYVFALFNEGMANTDINNDGELTKALGVLAANTEGEVGISSLLFITSTDLGIYHLDDTMI